MSTSENTNPRTTSNEPATKDDSTVPYKVSGEQELRGLSTSVDKVSGNITSTTKSRASISSAKAVVLFFSLSGHPDVAFNDDVHTNSSHSVIH
jgi:hypothetical protein